MFSAHKAPIYVNMLTRFPIRVNLKFSDFSCKILNVFIIFGDSVRKRSLHSVSGSCRKLHIRSRFLPFCAATAPLGRIARLRHVAAPVANARSIPFPAHAENSISVPAFFLFAPRPLRWVAPQGCVMSPRLWQTLAPFRFRLMPKTSYPLPLSSFLRRDPACRICNGRQDTGPAARRYTFTHLSEFANFPL